MLKTNKQNKFSVCHPLLLSSMGGRSTVVIIKTTSSQKIMTMQIGKS